MSVAAMVIAAAWQIQTPVAPTPLPSAQTMRVAPQELFALDVSLTLNGAPVGTIPVRTSLAGEAYVNVESLISALGSSINSTTAGALRAAAQGSAEASLIDLASDDLSLKFDIQTLRLIATTSQASSSVTALSLSGTMQREEGLTPPSNFAFGVTASVSDRYVHGGDNGQPAGEGPQASIRGFVNLGGIGGTYLTFDSGVLATRDRFGRSVGEDARITLFHDDVGRAIRYAAGYTDPTVMGTFQVPVRLVGFSVERLYSTIQPYRNLRSTGRGALTLDRESRVDVIINGITQRSLVLAPGRYDLRDFPFLDGVNDVRLVVEDSTGRREAASLSFFSDTELLDPGVFNFSAAVGVPEDRFTDIGFTDGSSLVASGYYQRGVNDRLTLGAAVQATVDASLVSMQSVFATDYGLIGAQWAIDLDNREDAQIAALLSWRQREAVTTGQQTGLSIDASYQSEGFSPLTQSFGFVNSREVSIDGRYQVALVGDVYATLGAGYDKNRDGGGDDYRVSAAVSRSFRRVSVNVSLDQRFGARGDETRFGVSLSMPLSRRTSIRARYQTDGNLATAEVDRTAYPGLDQFGYRASVTQSDDGQGFSGDAQYFGNRFSANARHDFADFGFGARQITEVSASTGIGYADGRFAIGREADRGFVIIDAHRTLSDSTVIARTNGSLGPSARTGALGPALAPLSRSYVRDSASVNVSDLPPGYDIGAGQINLAQGAASGYRFSVGSAASNTVLGRIVDSSGLGVPLLSGRLVAVSGDTTASVDFFTNRTGRLVAQRVKPGRYSVVPNNAVAITEIVVPEDTNGAIDIGDLVFDRMIP